MRLLINWVVTAVALYAADYLLDGIGGVGASSDWRVYAVMALIFAVVSMIAGPLLKILSLPLILITFGLFSFVVNAVVFMLASWVAQTMFQVPFVVDGFMNALLGSLIITIVTTVLNSLLGNK